MCLVPSSIPAVHFLSPFLSHSAVSNRCHEARHLKVTDLCGVFNQATEDFLTLGNLNSHGFLSRQIQWNVTVPAALFTQGADNVGSKLLHLVRLQVVKTAESAPEVIDIVWRRQCFDFPLWQDAFGLLLLEERDCARSKHINNFGIAYRQLWIALNALSALGLLFSPLGLAKRSLSLHTATALAQFLHSIF